MTEIEKTIIEEIKNFSFEDYFDVPNLTALEKTLKEKLEFWQKALKEESKD